MPDREARIRELWEDGEVTAADIGRKFGLSKSAVIGLAQRRGWHPRGTDRLVSTTTTMSRLDAIHAKFDAVAAAATRR